MTRMTLLENARKLKAPSPEVTAEFASRSNSLAEEVNRRMDQRADVIKLVGKDNLEMMHDNHRNHARFMVSLFSAYDAEVLVDTVLWVFRAYVSHGFSLAYWPAQLDTWVELFREELPEQALAEIYPIYNWLIVNQAHFVALSQQDGVEQQPVPSHH